MYYLLDANVFIEAKNRYYGFDFCPAFWDWLLEQDRLGRVHSIPKVRDELLAGTDQLADWAKAQGHGLFLPPDDALPGSLATVSEWVRRQGYSEAVVTAFLDGADYCIIWSATPWPMRARSLPTRRRNL